ncbi:MAG: MotA/TolQ/ExbB proton channel family protein [Thermodesulfobacteriota bacterium]
MDIATIIGIISGLGLILASILINAPIKAFFDLPSVFIVFGGTIAATLNSFPLGSVINALKTSFKIFFGHRIDYIATMQEMLKIAQLARKNGPVALEKYKTEDKILQKGLMLAADGTRGRVLREILELERDTTEERHQESQTILEKMGDLAPAWGMIGTLIGLVIMLLNLSDPSSIGPSMAVALLTTFYGAFWANFYLLPAANKLEQRTKREVVNINLVIETLVSITEAENPRLLQERLLVFLPPRERQMAVPKKSVMKKAA